MALVTNQTFVIYNLTTLKVDQWMTGSYDSDNLEADDRPITPRDFASATQSWMAIVGDIPEQAPADFSGSGTVPDVAYYVNTTTKVVSRTAGNASLRDRQNAVMKDINDKITSIAWTQLSDAKLTPSNRLAFAKYISDLVAIPTLQSTTWGTNPETVTYPTPVTPVFSAMDGGVQMLVDSSTDKADVPWDVLTGTSTNVTYPTTAVGQTGVGVLRATSDVVIHSPMRVKFDPNRMYKIIARIRRSGAAGTIPGTYSIGIQSYDAQGNRIGNDGTLDTNAALWPVVSAGLQSAFDGTAWVTLTGYVSGFALVVAGVSTGATNGGTILSPTKVNNKTEMIGGRALLNTGGGNSVMELDYLDIEMVDNAIVGDQVTARTIPRSKLMIGDLGTLMPEWMFDDPAQVTEFVCEYGTLTYSASGAKSGGSFGILTKTTAAGVTGTGGAWNTHLTSVPDNYVPVRENTLYTWSLDYRRWSGTWIANGNGLVFQLRFYDANKRLLGDTSAAGSGPYGLGDGRAGTGDVSVMSVTPSSTTFAQFDGKITSPIGARYVSLFVAIQQAEPLGVAAAIDNFRITRTMVTDDIGGGQISDQHVGSLGISATKLTSGFIPSGRFGTNTISGDAIVDGSLDETELSANAATQTGSYYLDRGGQNLAVFSVDLNADSIGVISYTSKGGSAVVTCSIEVGGVAAGRADAVFFLSVKMGSAPEEIISNNYMTTSNQWRGVSSFTVVHNNNFVGTVEYRLRAAQRSGSPVIPEIYRTRMSMIARWR